MSGAEQATLKDGEVQFHQQEYLRLCQELETASQISKLPAESSTQPALHDLLIRLRLG